MIALRGMLGRLRSEERGYSLPELSVAIIVGSVILGGLFVMINFSVRSNARITSRVAVDQVARPAMQRIVDELHSACIYPGLAPVRAGSTGSQLAFISSSGAAANPVPVLHKIVLEPSGVLNDYTYPRTGGTAPNWLFSASWANRFTLLPRALKIGTTPVFRYYKYTNGAISTTPLPAPDGTGLTSENAKLVVQVTIAFQASLSASADAIDKTSGASTSQNPVTLSESVLLRFSPSNEDTNKAGLPCT